jgi:protein-S-isoprenylcysteine O-methyltransferase Ste14
VQVRKVNWSKEASESVVLLLAPSWLALISLILNVAGYEWKIRIEEAHLRQAHGAAYGAYCARTGRYLPRLFRREEHV